MGNSSASGVTFQFRSDTSGLKAGASQAKSSIEDVTKSAGASKQAFDAQSDALAKLVGKIDPTVASLGKLDDQLNQLKAFKSSGAISGDDFANYAGKIGVARDELTKVTSATHGFGLQTNLAQREVTVLLGELARGNTARFESSLITLGRASGVMGLLMSGAGLAVLGTVGIIAGAVVAYEKGAAEQDAFNKALVVTGNAAGVTTGQLFAQASALGEATGEYSKAQDALTQLAGAGKLTGDSLTAAAQGAVALSVLTGQAIDKSVEDFNKLGDDPVKAIVELNDKYHFLTLAIYDQIKALQDQGDQEAATSLAVKTAADALDQRRQQIVDTAGSIEKAWLGVKAAVQGAIDNLKQVGRSDIDAQLSDAYAHQYDLQAAQHQLDQGGFQGFLGRLNAGPKQGFDEDVKSTDALIDRLQKLKSAQEDSNAEAAKDDALQQGGIKAADSIDKLSLSLDKGAAKQKALNDLQAQFKALASAPGPTDPRLAGVTQGADGNLSGGLLDKLSADIDKKYAEKGPKASSSAAASDLQALSNYADQLAEKIGGPLDEAFTKYNNQLTHADQLAEKALIDGGNINAILTAQQRAYTNATAALQQNIAAITLRNEKQANAGWDRDAKALADYNLSLDDQLDRLQKQIDAGGQLTVVQEAEYQIEQKLRGASQLEKDDLKETTDDILAKAKALDQLHAKQELQTEIIGTISQLIEGTRQGVISGETAFEALGKTAAQVLPGIANDFQKVLTNLAKANGGTVDFGKALSGLGDELKKELPALGQLVGTIAGGGGTGAQTGSAIGSIVGGIVGSLIPVIGTAIGAAIGGVLGGVIGGQGDGHGTPAVYGSSRPGSVGRNHSAAIDTPLGIFAADTNNLADDAYKAFEATVKGFDQQLARLFSPDQLKDVQDALEGFSGKFSDITSLLAARFAVVLGALGPEIQGFVTGFASDLQGQVQALSDVLDLQKLDNAGLLISSSFGDALTLITEFAKAGEGVLATYQRLVTSTGDYQEALSLMGLSFDGSKTQLVEFAQNIADAVGSTAEADTLWKKFFKDFYSTAQLTAANITQLQSKVGDSLTKIGLSAGISMSDFKAKFIAALPTLTPAEVANWLQAAGALGDLNDAISSLVTQGEALVDSLYGGGSLSDVNSEISDLESRSGQATNQVQHLGSAVNTFAQNAQSAAALLLGSLSPLNDQQKLQYALSGLRNGSVTQEQVLTIGRQLYASSQAYTDLFNMVQRIGQHTGFNSLSSNSGSTTSTDKPFTAADQTRLDELKARRDVLDARQRKQQADDLATTVAQLGLTQKESFQQVADELGFSLSDLGKDLGLNADELNTYLTNIQKQQTAIPDAVTLGSNNVVRALYDIAGKPLPSWADTPDPTGDAPDSASNVRGGHSRHGRSVDVATGSTVFRSGHSTRGTSDDVATAVATNTANLAQAAVLSNAKLTELIAAVRAGNDLARAARGPQAPGRRNARAAM